MPNNLYNYTITSHFLNNTLTDKGQWAESFLDHILSIVTPFSKNNVPAFPDLLLYNTAQSHAVHCIGPAPCFASPKSNTSHSTLINSNNRFSAYLPKRSRFCCKFFYPDSKQ